MPYGPRKPWLNISLLCSAKCFSSMCHLKGVLSGYTYISSYVTYKNNSEDSEGVTKKIISIYIALKKIK